MESSVIRGVDLLLIIPAVCRKERHPSAVEELVQHQAKGVDINSVVIGPACEDLRCHVGNRAHSVRHKCRMCRLHPFRGTEIAYLVIAEFINVQVRGIDITVDDAFLLTEGQRGADVLSYLQHLSNSERYAAPLMVGHHIDETCEELHSDIEGARIGSFPEIEIVDQDDVRRTA